MRKGSRIAFLLIHYFLFATCLRAQDVPMCSGNSNLLALVDRPSIAFSGCTVTANAVMIESGYSYIQLTANGFAHLLPQIEGRIGLPANSEIDIFPPSYNWQSRPRQHGFGLSGLGLKHIAYNDAHQLFTLQGYVTPPSGGRFYGTRHTGFLLNGIYSYTFSSDLNIAGLLGLANNTSSPANNNQHYYSFNPISVISYPLFDNHASWYIEFYGQSKTGNTQGWGLSFDSGLVVLVTTNLTIDVVYGQKMSGAINGITRYLGSGAVVRFG